MAIIREGAQIIKFLFKLKKKVLFTFLEFNENYKWMNSCKIFDKFIYGFLFQKRKKTLSFLVFSYFYIRIN